MPHFSIYEVQEEKTNSWFKISPERGGIVTSIGLHGQEILYLNEETFYDETSNVRGGIPILFPICDRLENNQYQIDNEIFTMKNHGFARNMPWTVKSLDKTNKFITLELISNEDTYSQYPFHFHLIFTFEICEGEFIMHQSYKNISGKMMPFYAGFHPYFKVENKDIGLITDAKKYLDVNDNKVKEIDSNLDLTKTQEALILLDTKEPKIMFPINPKQSLVLKYSREFNYMTLWSEPEKEFLCVEPWMAKPNSLNTKEDIQYIKPGEILHTFLTISLKER